MAVLAVIADLCCCYSSIYQFVKTTVMTTVILAITNINYYCCLYFIRRLNVMVMATNAIRIAIIVAVTVISFAVARY